MIRLLVLILATLALVAAETHDYWVGCTQTPLTDHHFGPDDFLLAVAAANRHLKSRIYVCCTVELYNSDFFTEDGLATIVFEHDIEIIGSDPKAPYSCPDTTHKLGPHARPHPNCTKESGAVCMQATAKVMKSEDFEDDIWDHPRAWVFSFGFWFVFNAKAKIHRMGFLADAPIDLAQAAKRNPLPPRTEMLKNIALGQPFTQFLPNGFYAGTATGDYSYELNIDESVIGNSFAAWELMIESQEPWLAWEFVSFAQELVIERSAVDAFDFHLLLRFSPVVEVEHSILTFLDNLVLEIIDEILGGGMNIVEAQAKHAKQDKNVELFFPYPQIELKIKETPIWFFDVKDDFSAAPVDLGVVSIFFPEYVPEILRLDIDKVFWFNLDRVIAAGSFFTLENAAYDFQKAKVEDFIVLINFD